MVQLTLKDKEEIIRALDNNKAIPEKFRFLLFGEKKQIELLWNGKGSEICNAQLPFQTIEQVDEPRSEKPAEVPHTDLFSLDNRGRQQAGWVNKLIWGDNKLILSSLKHGAMREQIKEQGGIKLIYIDPPFDVGANFSMPVEIGDGEIVKEPNILETLAYRDTWGDGHDSFIAMIYERLLLMHNLLADDGSIYVHCDYRVNAYIRLIMDEIFGKDNFQNEIIWRKGSFFGPANLVNKFPKNHDTILYYAKTEKRTFSLPKETYKESTLKQYKYIDEFGKYRLQELRDYTDISIEDFRKKGQIEDTSEGPKLKQYITREGEETVKNEKAIETVWTDINRLTSKPSYPTEKPEKLLKRIIEASSNEGDIIADFFCGSGVTAAVAEKLGRKWIAADLGKFAIHTTRKRMLGVQRELKKEHKEYRAFEILNLGKYERQHYMGINNNLRGEEKEKHDEARRRDFDNLILEAYQAEKIDNSAMFHGKRNNRMVCIGYFSLPVDRLFTERLINECKKHNITKVDLLGFEFEMGLFPATQETAKKQGIDLALKHIPPEVFDKRAVKNGEVVFYDVSYIDFKLHNEKDGLVVELTDFLVAYSRDSIKKSGGTIEITNGDIFFTKTNKKTGKIEIEKLTKSWVDWIDYWAVDFNFETKPEIIRTMGEDGSIKEKWTGNFIFENEWQSFRTKKDRTLELKSVAHKCEKGKRKVAIKVVDIFGNDTMSIKEIKI